MMLVKTAKPESFISPHNILWAFKIDENVLRIKDLIWVVGLVFLHFFLLLLLQIQNRPLTRYLPVRGDEDQFDLRAHIESSGHQLELCPHVIVTKTTARGFLSKLGSRFHNWNKRWFVFDRETRALTYYADKNEKKAKPRGGVHFQVRKYT